MKKTAGARKILRRAQCTFLTGSLVFLSLPAASAQSFRVDCSRWSGPPLVKTKFGVYQTPFRTLPELVRSVAFLREVGVQNLRYEMAWGKPDAYAFDQISGAARQLTFDFSRLDPFLDVLKSAQVTPLFALGYDPVPLKIGTQWQRWKDAPTDLTAWRQIVQAYAAHYRFRSFAAPFYEVWNEPELPGDGGKVFFNGSLDEYARVYDASVPGVKTGDADALVGGAATAYDVRYDASVAVAPASDFLSFHAYANAVSQIDAVRSLLSKRPDLPLFLTEYASFQTFGPASPACRHPAAAFFFRDVKLLLAKPDVTKVYWAQWQDRDLGMLTTDGHRRALFNALKLYQTQLPVDRSPVTPESAEGVGILAGSDAHHVGIALWNEKSEPKNVTVTLENLPFRRGAGSEIRIDATHGSFGDDPSTENLSVSRTWKTTGLTTNWQGEIPGESVVFLRVTDGKKTPPPSKIGRYVRSFHRFSHRETQSYADFDPRTCIARLGAGNGQKADAQIGILIENPPPKLSVRITHQGRFRRESDASKYGVQIDYQTKPNVWKKSVFFSAKTRVIAIAKNAPKNWNHRILLTPLLRKMDAGVQARFEFSASNGVASPSCSQLSAVSGKISGAGKEDIEEQIRPLYFQRGSGSF